MATLTHPRTACGLGATASAPARLMVSRDLGGLLGEIATRIGCWRRRARERRQLAAMSDYALKDLGLTRIDAAREYRKSVWTE